MNKRERTSQLKEIIKEIENQMPVVEGKLNDLLEPVVDRINDLQDSINELDLIQDTFDGAELIDDITVLVIDSCGEINDIKEMLENFKYEISDTIDEMNEGQRLDEWQEFYDEIENIESLIDTYGNDITTIEELIDSMGELKNGLTDLL